MIAVIKGNRLYKETESGLAEVDFDNPADKPIKKAYMRTLYDNFGEDLPDGRYKVIPEDEMLIEIKEEE